jgi:hypothetical protein
MYTFERNSNYLHGYIVTQVKSHLSLQQAGLLPVLKPPPTVVDVNT